MARYAIEPQRDSLKDEVGTCADGSTWFVKCEPAEAELWAVFELGDEEGDAELIEDFATKEAAERFVALLED